MATMRSKRTLDYKKLYDSIYSEFPNYGDLNHGKGAASIINDYQFNKVLELGCGDKSWLGMLDAKYKIGVDVSSRQADYNLDITKGLPFHDNSFDLIGCFDVMEHLEQRHIEQTLAEMFRVSHTAVFSISYQMSNYGLTHAFDLHATIKPEEWWLSVIKNAGYELNSKRLNKYLIFGDL